MVSRDFFRFNTANTISVESDDAGILDEALAWCDACELMFSRHNPASQLAVLNQARGLPTAVDGELAALVEKTLAYCQSTEGLFDLTMGSVTQLWDFKHQVIPSSAEISAALNHVDYRKVSVKDSALTLGDPQACIDLGGIAKGYIADGILALLKKRGVRHALVNLGGNVAVMGGKPQGGDLWRIGIRKPVASCNLPQLESFATVSLASGSVVTSGIYERAFMRGGALYHHILDPRTGMPAETDLLSATVVSSSSLDGDGYTTALIIMGCDQALAFTEENPALEAVFVTREGEVLATSGIGSDIPFEMLS